MRNRLRANRGFTVIELMIVIAIVGIIAVISIPNMIVWLSRMRLNGATTAIERQITITKKMSITNRMRYCMQFSGDSGWTDNNSGSYLVTLTVLEETAVNSGVWSTLTSPIELVGWTNDSTTERYSGISLEGDSATTTVFAGTSGCTGLLFNNSGYLDNPTSDFAFPCGGQNCAKLTLRNKAQRLLEQRTLWVDRGGNVRVTVGPNNPPVLATSTSP